jgi:hypothetical protein
MGSRRLILYLVLLSSVMLAQISVKTNLPEQIKINSETLFEAKIWKGPLKNFSKYQLELPQGITISEVDCKSGSFVQEDNIVKIIWAITPAEPEFTITLKLLSDNSKGLKTIHHKYNYLEKGEKREIEMSPIKIEFVETLGTVAIEPTVSANTLEDAGQSDASNSEDLKQQVVQLKKDSKEALEVGESERAAARKKLYEANEAIKRAKGISNEKERSASLQKAMAEKDKAETDLAIANRILTLAKSLQDNAAEIEKLNQTLDSVGVTDKKSMVLDKNTGKSTSENAGNAVTETGKSNSKEVEKAKETAIKKGTKDAKGLYKPIAVNPHNIKELIQQVEQIKKDSKDAQEVGTREKRKAEQKLAESYEALKRAEYITDEEEKKQLIDKATKDKLKAEKDLEVASKILVLAQSLKDNANEIETINAVEPSGKVEVVANTDKNTNQTNQPDVKKEGEFTDNQKNTPPTKEKDIKPVKEIAEAVKPTEIKEPTKTGSEDMVYRLQIGAFTKTPDKSQFTQLGKVEVLMEGDKFKAFYGKFKTREEAVIQRDQLKTKGFDPFVVVFKNGQKVK